MFLNKYERTNFYDDKEVNGIVEKDFLSGYLDRFEIKRPVQYFTISRSYIARPDLLSLKLYGKMSYWWILGYVNNIHDWWNDLNVEDVIKVPNIQDIEDWYTLKRSLQKNK